MPAISWVAGLVYVVYADIFSMSTCIFVWVSTHLHVQAHQTVTIGVEWHPLETSKVATCGWDGLIKYWD